MRGRGACMVVGMCSRGACMVGGCAWWGACMAGVAGGAWQGGVRCRYYEIR